jgi:hypothetical protein
VFTVEQRDALRERVLRLAEEDGRVVAGAVVGSLAVGGGDRFSDVDLTFGIADHVPVTEVLDDWTAALTGELGAVQLADLERGPATYRVFLLPDALQLDLSMTPAARFRPAGPRFRLLFGETAAGDPGAPPPAGELFIPTPPVAGDLFGWGVIYALHARACIERRRVWQAEHYVGAVRDHALSLACLHQGLPAVQARGYDDFPLRPWPGSGKPTPARPSQGRCVRPSPHLFGRSCARARRRMSLPRRSSRSGSRSLTDVLAISRARLTSATPRGDQADPLLRPSNLADVTP